MFPPSTTNLPDADRSTILMKKVIENSDDIFCFQEPDGRIAFLSGAEKFGISSKEAVGKMPGEVFDTESALMIIGNIRQVAASSEAMVFEKKMNVRGERVWLLEHIYPVIEGGNVVGVATISRNITERKKAEEKLRLSEQKYRTLADEIADGAAIVVRNRLVWFNKAFSEIVRLPYDDVWGKEFTTLFSTLTESSEWRQLRIDMRDGKSIPPCQMTVYRLDGGKRVIEIAVKESLFDERGAVQIIMRDITERKKSEAALAESEKKFKMIVQNASDGINLLDGAGRFIEVNPQTCRFSGYLKEELIGLSAHVVNEPSMSGNIQERLALLNDLKPHVWESLMKRRDGSTFFAEVSAVKISENEIISIVRDIDDRKKTEKEFLSVVQSEAFEKLFLKLREFGHGESMLMTINRLALFAKNIEIISTGENSSSLKRVKIAVDEYSRIVYPELVSIASLIRSIESELNDSTTGKFAKIRGSELSATALSLKDLCEKFSGLIEKTSQSSMTSGEFRRLVSDLTAGIRHILHEARQIIEFHFSSDISETIQLQIDKFLSIAPAVQFSFDSQTDGCRGVCDIFVTPTLGRRSVCPKILPFIAKNATSQGNNTIRAIHRPSHSGLF